MSKHLFVVKSYTPNFNELLIWAHDSCHFIDDGYVQIHSQIYPIQIMHVFVKHRLNKTCQINTWDIDIIPGEYRIYFQNWANYQKNALDDPFMAEDSTVTISLCLDQLVSTA